MGNAPSEKSLVSHVVVPMFINLLYKTASPTACPSATPRNQKIEHWWENTTSGGNFLLGSIIFF